MCGSMADIQSSTAENRQGKKERKKERKKPQLQNIMSASATQGGRKKADVSTTFKVLKRLLSIFSGVFTSRSQLSRKSRCI